MASTNIMNLLLPLLEDDNARRSLEAELSKSLDGVTTGKQVALPSADPGILGIKQELARLRGENAPTITEPLTRGQKIKANFQGEQGAALATDFAVNTDFSSARSVGKSALATGGAVVGSAFGPIGTAAGGFLGGLAGGLLGDDEDEAEKERKKRVFRQNVANFSAFLDQSNRGLFNQALTGRSFF